MLLERLYLKNFRNYTEATISFGPKINVIRGNNAQGKTNLLEALYLLGTGRSFRTQHLCDLIRQGEKYFYLKAEFIKEEIPQVVQIFFDGETRRIQINHRDYAAFSSLMGLFPTVLHAPEDIFLISGAPSDRRRFINVHIAQTDPLYVHHLLRYHKAMKQRNTLLKQKNEQGIQSWEQAMALSAGYLVGKRQKTVTSLNGFLQDEMKGLSSDQDKLEIRYLPPYPIQEKEEELSSFFCALWKKQRQRELYLGTTLSGPHRDDLLILLNQKPAKNFSSEGQKKCCATALRFAEWQRLKSMISSFPLLSLDDFEVHLDAQRQHYLKSELKNFGQVFLTSPYQKAGNDFLQSTHELIIEKGQIL